MAKKNETRGRRPAEDPKKPVRVYINTSKIEALGGMEAAQQISENAINRAAKRVKT